MLADVLPYLRCPVCHGPFAADAAGRTLRCAAGHSFDVARHGQVDLLTGRVPHTGDTAQMIAARDEFLRAGHFAAIASGLVRAATAQLCSAGATTGAAPLVVDAGAGTGFHLAAVLDALPGGAGLALDISKAAVRRAARAHPAAAAVRCDTWRRLPVADGCADLLLNVFAPRNGAEFARVLRPGGTLVVVTPLPEHLGELVRALGLLGVDPAKEDRLAASLDEHFAEVSRRTVREQLPLTHRDADTVVRMGPSAWHTDPAGSAAALAALPDPVEVTVAVRLTTYRLR